MGIPLVTIARGIPKIQDGGFIQVTKRQSLGSVNTLINAQTNFFSEKYHFSLQSQGYIKNMPMKIGRFPIQNGGKI